MKPEEQLSAYSNLVEDVQHLHETQRNPFSCEQKMLLEWMPLVLHSNAVLK